MSYNIGDTARISVAFTDLNNNPVDPTNVTLTVQVPDGTQPQQTWPVGNVVHDSTGNFHFDFVVTVAGIHTYEWLGTGTVTVTSTGNFTVNPSPLVIYGSPLDLCSLQEIKDWLDLTVDTQDRKLSRLITSASTLIRQKIERNLEAANYTERRNGNGGDRMVLKNTPINSVISVTVDDVPVPQSTDGVVSGWAFDSTTVYLVTRGSLPIAIYPYLSGAWQYNRGYQNCVISYNGGYQTVPLDLKQAAMELVTQKFNRSKHSDQRSQSIGGEVISYSEKEMPDEVMLVINRYRQRSFIAP